MSVSAEEVAKHNTDKDCWVIVGDQVLDVTNFLSEHPGGKKSIMMFAGKDATEEFDMLHDRKVIKKYGIDEGTVAFLRKRLIESVAHEEKHPCEIETASSVGLVNRRLGLMYTYIYIPESSGGAFFSL
ncbi:unnamed protein product [Cladocopium goreaui]|uniref:Cytochrome b5 (CYTB5) n=1 Tax=Cladocopium goreaui TaxID=2562237 RepID=A0A9P1GAV4_9DINO|nr:unnamed protein product [Cladocopium goreaui]